MVLPISGRLISASRSCRRPRSRDRPNRSTPSASWPSSYVPKQYRKITGEPVIRPALAAFLGHPRIAAVQPVIHALDAEAFRAATAGLKSLSPVSGGATRQASVRAGLEALRGTRPDIVLIHDAGPPVPDRRPHQPRDRCGCRAPCSSPRRSGRRHCQESR